MLVHPLSNNEFFHFWGQHQIAERVSELITFAITWIHKAKSVEVLQIEFVIVMGVSHHDLMVFQFLFNRWEVFDNLWHELFFKKAFVKNTHTVDEFVIFFQGVLERGLADVYYLTI